MNVDWDWVKQRPHFLARHLAKSHDLVVVYPHSWRRRYLVENDRSGLRLRRFFRMPFGGKFPFISLLNTHILRVMAWLFMQWHRPDIVWVSSPELFKYLPGKLQARLIYDCMDDVLAFPSNAPRREILAASENELVAASSRVLCSSGHLLNKLSARAGYPEKYAVIHNAFEPSAFRPVAPRAESVNSSYVLGYVGTLSSWLDIAALLELVNAFPSLEVHLIGPIENLGSAMPGHARIRHLGAVRHEDLPAQVNRFDALLMPFLVTELILSVDPVKLYEYVFFDKPIVSVNYPELERFADFVDFYTSYAGLLSIIQQYLDTGFRKKYSAKQRREFIAVNTWAERVAGIEKILSLEA